MYDELNEFISFASARIDAIQEVLNPLELLEDELSESLDNPYLSNEQKALNGQALDALAIRCNPMRDEILSFRWAMTALTLGVR